MSTARESDIIQAFLSLSTRLSHGYDVVDLLAQLTADCAKLLDVASSGLLLADAQGVLHVLAASSERTRELEAFQIQRDEGPCLECYSTGAPVNVPDLRVEAGRWPIFVPAAQVLGFVSVHTVPLRLRDEVLGALNLFGTKVGSLTDDDLALAQALADVACVALIQEHAAADRETVNQQLKLALASRVVIEQAKGVLAQLGTLDMAEAFESLRGYARDNNLKLTDVARAVVEESLASAVLEHARGRVSTQ